MEWLPLVFVCAVVGAWAVWTVRRLAVLRDRLHAAWRKLDIELTRRHELIPELVRIVTRYTDHEHVPLEKLTRLRTQAIQTASPGPLAAIEDELGAVLRQLLALPGNNHDLRASEAFHQLGKQLVALEEQLACCQGSYNEAVGEFNRIIAALPERAIARLFRLYPAEPYASEGSHRLVSAGQLPAR